MTTTRPVRTPLPHRTTPRVAIVGAGASGIALAVKLRAAGIDTFTVFESSDAVGGTWRDNTYPGLYCDVPSRYYSFSFAPWPGWSRVFAPGTEIRDYLDRVVDDFDVRRFIRFSTRVVDATWAEPEWRVVLDDGTEQRFDVLVAATGVLRDPKIPGVPGLGDFAGASRGAWPRGSSCARTPTASRGVPPHRAVGRGGGASGRTRCRGGSGG